METIWDWGISVIKAMQALRCAPLDWLAFAIHYGCNTPVYLLIIMFYTMCVDYTKGFHLGATLMFSTNLNGLIKNLLAVPRPYIRDKSVFRITEEGWSTPSGHSQSASTTFPLVAHFQRNFKPWARLVLAIAVPLLIAVSRNYLGVHYPTDVLGGLLLGYIVSLGYIFWGQRLLLAVTTLRPTVQTLIWALLSFPFLIATKEVSNMTGAFFGLGVGYTYVMARGGFDAAKGTPVQKLLRLLLAFAVYGVVYYGLTLLFPKRGSDLYHLFRFLRYALSSFCTMFAAPLLSIKLRLAEAGAAEQADTSLGRGASKPTAKN